MLWTSTKCNHCVQLWTVSDCYWLASLLVNTSSQVLAFPLWLDHHLCNTALLHFGYWIATAKVMSLPKWRLQPSMAFHQLRLSKLVEQNSIWQLHWGYQWYTFQSQSMQCLQMWETPPYIPCKAVVPTWDGHGRCVLCHVWPVKQASLDGICRE